jgi:tRNA-modifying protein YgfZ
LIISVHSSWQDFLAARAARIEAGVVAHFGAPDEELRAAPGSTILADLSHFALIEASGADAREFLNNQLTNDLAKVDDAHAQYTGYCSPKGRLLANFLLWRRDEAFFLMLDAELRAAIQKRLSMYVLRSKVKLGEAREDMVCLGVAGAQASALLQKVLAPPPGERMGVARVDAVTIIQLDAARYQLVLPAERAPALWDALVLQARPVGAPVWRWLDTRAGIPWISPRTQEQFVPQMTNFDRFGALTYGKGCYPGQEIVARTHYLGKIKRRMYLGHVDSAAAPGDELFSAAFGEQSCGMIVNAAPAPEGGYDALAVLQVESRDQSIHLSSIGGSVFSILDQPYTLE